MATKSKPKLTNWAYADSICAKRLLAWHAEGAKFYSFGVQYVALGDGGFSYMGDVLRVHHPEAGLFVAILNGHNCRVWGTEHGRLEMAHGGKAAAGSRDPAPGVLAPWHQLCELSPVTNGWTPRKCEEFDALLKLIGAARDEEGDTDAN